MRKIVFYLALFSQLFFFMLAQDIEERELALDELEVSASTNKVYSELGRVLTVINKQEIERLPVRTIDELLDYVGGVDIRQRGAAGVQVDVSIRGGSFDQVLILLNGINITNPQTGHYNLDMPVDLGDVARIEVLQGSSARVLGLNAFSGAINIVTEQPDDNCLSAAVTAGSYNTTGQSVSASYGAGGFRAFASATKQRSDGYIDNTDYDMTHVFLHLTQHTEKSGKFGLQAGYQQKAYGANGFYSLSYPDQFDHIRTFFSALTWSLNRPGWLWNGQLYWKEHHDRYELIRNSAVGRNFHQTDVAGGKFTVARILPIGKFTLGTDLRNEHIFSTVLGEPMPVSKPIPFEGEARFTHEKNRLIGGLFADYSGQFNRMSVSLGGAANYASGFGMFYSGGVDWGYELVDGLKLVASYNSAVRLPTFTDLYYQNATQLSNPDLQPETSHTFEIGGHYKHGRWDVRADVYYRLGNNIIDWVKQPDSVRWESRNLTDVNALGGDVSVRYTFGTDAFVRGVSLDYSYLHLDRQAEGFDSKYALDYLKHKCRLSLEHKVWKRLGLMWNASFNDRFGTYADFATGEQKEYAPYFLLDAKLMWKSDDFNVFAEAKNILNAQYADYAGLPQPGINWNVGVRVNVSEMLKR